MSFILFRSLSKNVLTFSENLYEKKFFFVQKIKQRSACSFKKAFKTP